MCFKPILKILFAIFQILLLFFIACEKQPSIEQPREKILVNIDNKVTISLNEFIRRAEYTPRPAYCRHNNYIHKKIILNSLIAEKLLAIEAGDSNEMTQSEFFQAYIKGRREQAMRQWMHHQEATAKVKLDSSELKNIYRLAGREYEIEYYAIHDSTLLDAAQKKFTESPAYFEQLYQTIYQDSVVPTRKISWNSQENLKIHATLFSKNYEQNQIVAPIKIDDNYYLLIKIKGWSDTKVMTPTQISRRRDEVVEKVTEIKASGIWKQVVGEIMRGKTIRFNEDTFYKVSKIFFRMFFKSDQEKKDAVREKIWDMEKDEPQTLNDLMDETLLEQPFFIVDGQTWTVQDFRRALMSHPLVYRDRKMPSNEFNKQFKLAVVDMIRDHFVTQEAYKRGYDEVKIVQRNEQMWRDAFLAVYQKNNYLREMGEKKDFGKNYMRLIGQYLNSYVDSLQQKYYKKIELDFEAFENQSLTSIDLFVKQKFQPFPHVVPLFPVLTTDHYIDYVTRMKRSEGDSAEIQ